MAEDSSTSGWVWVIVCDDQDGGHYLGLHNEALDSNFIPAFPSREAAGDCFLNLPREPGKKYEIQAIHIEELNKDADKSGFKVALVDRQGTIQS